MAETKLSLTLLIDSKANKVLYAESGHDFVDFLFHILSLPVGTAVKLLNENGTAAWSIGSVYKSFESLSSKYFQSNVNKDDVLKPNAVVNVPLLKLNDVPPTTREIYICGCCGQYWGLDSSTICPDCHEEMEGDLQLTYVPSLNAVVNVPLPELNDKFYICAYCGEYWSHGPSSICPDCDAKIGFQLTYVPPKNAANISTGGYVKEGIIFMVMDNLEVKPLSTMSGISVMDKFNVKDYSALVEKKVQVGFTEGLAILKASFEITDSVLTTVFLSNLQTCS